MVTAAAAFAAKDKESLVSDALQRRIIDGYRFNAMAAAREELGARAPRTKLLQRAQELLQLHETAQRTRLAKMGDVYYQMPWTDFLRIISEYGFEPFVSEAQEFTYNSGLTVPIYELVAGHREQRLILHAISVAKLTDTGGLSDVLFAASLFGAVAYDETNAALVNETLGSWREQTPWEGLACFFAINVKEEGLVTPLRYIEENLEFSDWLQKNLQLEFPNPFFPGGTEFERERREEVLEHAPDWVKAFMHVDAERVAEATRRYMAKMQKTFDDIHAEFHPDQTQREPAERNTEN